MANKLTILGKLRVQVVLVDTVLGVVERVWAGFPHSLRLGIKWVVGLMIAWATGVMASVVVWVGNFATEYGALAVLTILGAAGAATIFKDLGERLIDALDRRAEQLNARLGLVEPPPMDEEERYTIQGLRRVWHRHGHKAMEGLRTLFRMTKESLPRERYMIPALDPVWMELEDAIGRMDTVVAMNSKERIEAVRSRFNEAYAAYLLATKWLARIDMHETMGAEYETRLLIWRSLHVTFFEEVRDLVSDPRHVGKYDVFVDPDLVGDAAYAWMIRWLRKDFEGDTPTLSAYRTEAHPYPESESGDPER